MKFLFKNIRPIILIGAALIAGIVYRYIFAGPSASALKYILLTDAYAHLALLFLYLTLLQSPLYSFLPNLPLRALYSRAKRALGVSAFGFAFLHACFAFFMLLGGFSGLAFLNSEYILAISLSFTALVILSLMAMTSFDFAVKRLGKHWKQLHRFVYLAGFLIISHALLIGPSFIAPDNFFAQFVFVAVLLLFLLEILRINKYYVRKNPSARFSWQFWILLALWILAIIGLYTLRPHHASAHVLEHQGSIGAIMHISPDDDPVIGQPAIFYFEIKDTTGKFKPELCDCTLHISFNDSEVFSQDLFSGELKYTFPAKGHYDITIIGAPKVAGEFENFDLDFDREVSKTTPAKTVNHTGHIIIIGAGALVAFAMIAYDFFQNKEYYQKKFRLSEK